MARTLSAIYNAAKAERDKYLELTEFKNSSKMSILDAFTWVVATCIWTHENMLDVFKVDLAEDLQSRINGTPSYFANALLKYQSGDELVISDDGTACSYANINKQKRIISKVSYSEVEEENFNDKVLLLKVAQGIDGVYRRIDDEELLKIRAYLNKLLFAGQHAMVVSRNGDVLVPKITVYYDGSVDKNTLYDNVASALRYFVANIPFDGVVYVQKIIDAIQSVAHVVDVKIGDDQGIFVAQYDDENKIIVDASGNKLKRIDRFFIPNSGFIKESTELGEEQGIPTWSSSINFKVEDKI